MIILEKHGDRLHRLHRSKPEKKRKEKVGTFEPPQEGIKFQLGFPPPRAAVRAWYNNDIDLTRCTRAGK